MTKLDDEIAGVGKTVKNATSVVKDNIQMLAPRWLINLIQKVVESEATPWFMFGMAVEGLGITIQFAFNQPAYPILDFLVGGGLGIALLYYQGQRYEKEHGDDES